MTLSIDDLVAAYTTGTNAEFERWINYTEEQSGDVATQMRRAGIIAVVEQVMEHIVTGASSYAWDADDLHREFLKILAPRGDEAAGGK